MINLDTIDSAFHSVQIKDADGDVLAIDASGKIAAVVEATNLDIRDLAFATDKVDVSGSSVSISGSVAVTATDLDIRDLNSASDSVAAVQSGTWTVELGSTTLAALESITVVATQLDIDDLDYTADNVAIKGATGNQLVVNADGSINAAFTEAGYGTWSVVKETVTNSAAQLVASPLSNRLRIEIQNLGSADIYIKQNNTSVLDGLKIAKGSSYEQVLDAGAAIYAITASGSSDVRIAQYAA